MTFSFSQTEFSEIEQMTILSQNKLRLIISYCIFDNFLTFAREIWLASKQNIQDESSVVDFGEAFSSQWMV